eukprot:535366_1
MVSETLLLATLSPLLIFLTFTNAASNWVTVTVPPLSVKNSAMAVGHYNSSIFLVGGYDQQSQLMEYKIHNNQMINLGTSKLSNTYADGMYYAQYNEIIYMIDGDLISEGDKISIFNMKTQTYTDNWKTNLYDGDGEQCVAAYNNLLFIMGGYNLQITTYYNNLQVLDLCTKIWIPNMPSMKLARREFACIVHPDTEDLYAIGGLHWSEGHQLTNTVEKIYVGGNTETETWVYTDTLDTAVRLHRAVISYENILIVGGFGSSQPLGIIQIIDSINGETSSGGLLDYKVFNAAVINVNNVIYAFGGKGELGYLLDTWQYYIIPPPASNYTPEPTNNSICPTNNPTSISIIPIINDTSNTVIESSDHSKRRNSTTWIVPTIIAFILAFVVIIFIISIIYQKRKQN